MTDNAIRLAVNAVYSDEQRAFFRRGFDNETFCILRSSSRVRNYIVLS